MICQTPSGDSHGSEGTSSGYVPNSSIMCCVSAAVSFWPSVVTLLIMRKSIHQVVSLRERLSAQQQIYLRGQREFRWLILTIHIVTCQAVSNPTQARQQPNREHNTRRGRRDLPGVAVMKNSASSVPLPLRNVWMARGGTVTNSPCLQSTSPSVVTKVTVPLVTKKHSSWKRCQCTVVMCSPGQ